MDRPAQLPLDLPLAPRFGREDFLVGPSNEVAFDMIERWPEWPGHELLLIGPEGSGKSHLAAIWAERADARTLSIVEATRTNPATLAACPALVVEDVDRLGRYEAALFHLINALRGSGAYLVMTARSQPDSWGLTTPDLLSRLRRAMLATIAAPDDALLRALMVKHFIDRQLTVDTSVVEYLMPRIERSFASVAATVEALDRESLALGRRVTRPMAAKVLGRDIDEQD